MKILKSAALACLLLFAGTAMASGYRSVVVTLTDGTTNQITLTTSLKTTFLKTLVIFTDGAKEVTFNRAQIESFHFDGSNGGAEMVGVEESRPVVGNGEITFGNLPVGSKVALYDLQGRCLVSAGAEGSYRMELPNLEKGIYIVKVNRMSYKITVM